MKQLGEDNNLLVAARSALLDALEALNELRESVIVVGAQAVYMHTGSADVALAEATKDSDLVVDPRELADDPLIEDAMEAAQFYMNPLSNQPGAWMSPTGIPVDLMVPEQFAGAGKKGARAAAIPPHDKRATRRARGLEATLVDHAILTVRSLDPADAREYEANVAGPAALLVAKLHKLGERETTPTRLVDKDAHDLYRLLRAVSTDGLAADVKQLLHDDVSSVVTEEALVYLDRMFAAGPSALGAVMAGRAEQGIGNPVEVSLSVALLAEDLLKDISAD